MGEFFGQPKEDSEKALAAFAQSFDWGAADIEQALRSFLEAQKPSKNDPKRLLRPSCCPKKRSRSTASSASSRAAEFRSIWTPCSS